MKALGGLVSVVLEGYPKDVFWRDDVSDEDLESYRAWMYSALDRLHFEWGEGAHSLSGLLTIHLPAVR